MMSKTISITIPDQLEEALQEEAHLLGLSRSRFICNILLNWQIKNNLPVNDCSNLDIEWCKEFNMTCKAPQSEAETCTDYRKEKKV